MRQFDDFVAREVPKIEASPAYAAASTILITWHESAGKPLDPGDALLVAMGSKVATGVVSRGSFDRYSLLRTIDDEFGLSYLAHAWIAKPVPI